MYTCSSCCFAAISSLLAPLLLLASFALVYMRFSSSNFRCSLLSSFSLSFARVASSLIFASFPAASDSSFLTCGDWGEQGWCEFH